MLTTDQHLNNITMSTILDSLKKSSDKRDDHEKTSIDNFNFSHSKKSSKSGIIMFVFLIVTTAAILYFGYQYVNKQTDTSQKTTDAAIVNPQDLQQNNGNNTPVSKPTNNINSKKLQKPNSEAVKKQLTEAKQPQSNIATKNVAQKSNENLAQIDKLNTKNIEAKPISEIETSTTKTNSLLLNPTTEKPMIELSLPDETKNQKEIEAKPVVKKQEYMYVYQLPFAVRKEMPKFKLNIHIYDENPESRVAVINGVKFAVNDLIDEQVLIKEIVREGVVLEFNNHVFLVPIL